MHVNNKTRVLVCESGEKKNTEIKILIPPLNEKPIGYRHNTHFTNNNINKKTFGLSFLASYAKRAVILSRQLHIL